MLKTLLLTALLAIAGPLTYDRSSVGEAAQVTLTWTINAPSATETRIERKLGTQPDADYAQITAVPSPTAVYIDKTVTPNTIYCWRLRSANPITVSVETPGVCLLAPITGIVLIYQQ